MPNLSSAAWKLGTLMVPFHAAAKGSETGLGNKQHIWIMKRKKVTCLDSPETVAMWGTPSVAAPGPVKGHFLPRSALQSLLFVPRKCGGAGSGEIGARPDFLCGPAAPRAARPSGTLRGRELHVQPLRAGPRSYWAPSATPLSPALSSRPLQPAPSQPGFQRKEDASLPRRFRINRVTPGSRTGARTPRLDRGGGVVGRERYLNWSPSRPLAGRTPVGQWSGRAPPRAVTPESGAGWDGAIGLRKMCRGCLGEERRPR